MLGLVMMFRFGRVSLSIRFVFLAWDGNNCRFCGWIFYRSGSTHWGSKYEARD